MAVRTAALSNLNPAGKLGKWDDPWPGYKPTDLSSSGKRSSDTLTETVLTAAAATSDKAALGPGRVSFGASSARVAHIAARALDLRSEDGTAPLRCPTGPLFRAIAGASTKRVVPAVSLARSSESVFEGLSPGVSSPAVRKYDVNAYYNKLGVDKCAEDIFLYPYGVSPDAAYKYLAQRIVSPDLLSIADYMHVQELLRGRKESYRRAPSTTWSRTPFNLMKWEGKVNKVEFVPELLQFKLCGWGEVVHVGVVRDGSATYDIYRFAHNSDFIAEKLGVVVSDFNKQMAAAVTRDDKLQAICLFFYRCEQLQPVMHSRRVNLAMLNYLLAKHDFLLVIFKQQLKFTWGEIVSSVDMIDFTHFMTQVKEGMKNWCEKAKVAYEEDL